MLEGETVIKSVANAWGASADEEFEERFLIALQAGEDAGGDKRF